MSISDSVHGQPARLLPVGDCIVPVTPNGRVYECRVAGNTQERLEPEFPDVYGWKWEGFLLTPEGTAGPQLTWSRRDPLISNVMMYALLLVLCGS